MDDNKVAVLLEDLRTQFGVFGEGLKIVKTRPDSIHRLVLG